MAWGSCFLLAASLSLSTTAQNTVTIRPSVQRYVGDVSSLKRSIYFNQHTASFNDSDVKRFQEDYDVGFGRSFWGPFGYAKSKTKEVGVYPDGKPTRTGVLPVRKVIQTAHPADVIRYNLDKEKAAEWVVEYYRDVINNDERPEYYELMNEPFVHAKDAVFKEQQSDTQKMRVCMAEWYAAVGKAIQETPELANMKVVGYSSAWPSMELWDFGHWTNYQKMFMDTAGEYMDAFAIHLYDGINVTGADSRRSGSNSEAILDLVETYSNIKWGKTKPFAITEYGGIEKGYGDTWNELASQQSIRSINHIIFNLLEREDDMMITIPFITEKAKWHITEANGYMPYGAVLFVPSVMGVPVNSSTQWVYTPRIYFYELWKGVKGDRVDIHSGNPDVQTQAFMDGNTMYVILNNLDMDTQEVTLEFPAGMPEINNVERRALMVWTDKALDYDVETMNQAPARQTLRAGETVLLAYNFKQAVSTSNRIVRKKYYSNTYLQPISANSTMSFQFSGIQTGTGRATLRMAIGRKHSNSKQPVVKLNGTEITVPSNWKGGDQANRDDFFGVIDIPFDMALLDKTNTVSVTFPDNGGHLASLILSTERYDTPISTLESELANGNFEKGTLAPWDAWNYWGNVELDGNSAEGNYAALLTGASGMKQEIALERNTSYSLTCQAQVKDGDTGTLSVVVDGQPTITKQITSTSYEAIEIPFESGTSESASVSMAIKSQGGQLWVDNIQMTAESTK